MKIRVLYKNSDEEFVDKEIDNTEKAIKEVLGGEFVKADIERTTHQFDGRPQVQIYMLANNKNLPENIFEPDLSCYINGPIIYAGVNDFGPIDITDACKNKVLAGLQEKIVAVIKKPYQKPETVAIDKGLKPLQEIVNGGIDVVYLPNIDDIHGYCNDEGLLIGMEPNFYRPDYGDAIVGPAVFMSSGEGGESESLSPEQVKRITDYLEANSVKDFSEFLYHINTGFANYKPKKQSCM